MTEVKDNKIKHTRGDTLPLEFTINDKNTGRPYEPEEGDTCRFAISVGYKEDDDYELVLEKAVPLDTLAITLTSAQTKIPYGTYNYDVQITHADTTVETFISSKITITGECE